MSAPVVAEPTGAELEIQQQMVWSERTPDTTHSTAEPTGEARTRALRIAEYAPFTRISRHQHKRLGVTSDGGGPMLRVAAREREKPGVLLRVVVRGIDGERQLDTLARVAWCRENDTGHFSLGLAVVDGNHRKARLVRRLLEETTGAITA